jgi:hypothetical protein
MSFFLRRKAFKVNNVIGYVRHWHPGESGETLNSLPGMLGFLLLSPWVTYFKGLYL